MLSLYKRFRFLLTMSILLCFPTHVHADNLGASAGGAVFLFSLIGFATLVIGLVYLVHLLIFSFTDVSYLQSSGGKKRARKVLFLSILYSMFLLVFFAVFYGMLYQDFRGTPTSLLMIGPTITIPGFFLGLTALKLDFSTINSWTKIRVLAWSVTVILYLLSFVF